MKKMLTAATLILLAATAAAAPNKARYVVLTLRDAGLPVAGARVDEKAKTVDLTFKAGATAAQKKKAQQQADAMVLTDDVVAPRLDAEDKKALGARRAAKLDDDATRAIIQYMAKTQGKPPADVKAELKAIIEAGGN